MAVMLWCHRPDKVLKAALKEFFESERAEASGDTDVLHVVSCLSGLSGGGGLTTRGSHKPAKKGKLELNQVCRECGYATSNQLTLDFHMIHNHGWKVPTQKGGRPEPDVARLLGEGGHPGEGKDTHDSHRPYTRTQSSEHLQKSNASHLPHNSAAAPLPPPNRTFHPEPAHSPISDDLLRQLADTERSVSDLERDVKR